VIGLPHSKLKGGIMKKHRRYVVSVVLLILMTSGFSFGLPSQPGKPQRPSASSAINPGTVVNVERLDPAMGQVELVGRVIPQVNGLTAQQRTKLEAMKPLSGDLQITMNDRNGTPVFMVGQFGKVAPTKPGRFAQTEAIARQLTSDSQVHLAMAETFLDQFKEVLKLDNPSRELRLKDYAVDDLGFKHLKFEQIYHGVPVWASELILHLDANDEIYALNGRFEPTPNRITSVEAQVSAHRAIEIVTGDLGSRGPIKALPSWMAGRLRYDGPTAEKVIFPTRRTGELQLAWMVNVRPNFAQNWYYFIDAHTGEVLLKYNATNYQDGPTTGQGTDLNGQPRQLNVVRLQGTFFMIDAARSIFNAQRSQLPSDPVGALWTIDARNRDLDRGTNLFQVTSATNTFSDLSSVSAHFNVGQVFEYFLNTHQRRAIDGMGGTIVSVIHVTDENQPMDNAYWNGAAMAYGDGNVGFKPLAGGLDVAAHEMTHGVTERTANLVYLSQSGALNESMSDVFGVMVDRDDFKIGEDVVRPNVFTTGALRDLENPNQGLQRGDRGWQPAHMNEFVNLPETEQGDNGGVHVNSGIPNRAAALIIKAINRSDAEKIYYRALTTYLTRNSQFSDARLAVVRAATDLFGAQSTQVTAVNQAFDTVGIGGQMTPPPPPPPPATGTNLIAYVRPDYTIGLISPDGALNLALTNMFGRVNHDPTGGDIAKLSVPRDGKTVWFTRTDGLLGLLDISNLSNILEFRLPNLGIRRVGDIINAAARPDAAFSAASGMVSGGLALTSTDRPDPFVYLVDFGAGTLTQVQLVVPTTGQGAESNTIAFADVVDWFVDGRLIIYDAFNQVQQAGGGTLAYWSFNLLRVPTRDSLAALPPQPEGISVGNPQFGSVSVNLVAYNEIDDRTGNIQLKVVDYNESEIFTLVDPAQQGFGAWRPTFSPDDRGMAFVDVRNAFNVPFFGTLIVADLVTGNVRVPGNVQVLASNPEWFACQTCRR
jgi:Zn-dependent metalloprotease